MDILEKILEILTTPIVITSVGSLSIGTAIMLIIKALVSPKKSELGIVKQSVLELTDKQGEYVSKSEFDNLVNVVKEQNELEKEIISKTKNVAVRQELETKRLAIENNIPKQTIVEKENVVVEPQKATKKRRF